MEGFNDLYDEEEDGEDPPQFRYGASDDEEDEDNDGQIRDGDDEEDQKEQNDDKKKGKYKHDKIEVNFDDIDDEDD